MKTLAHILTEAFNRQALCGLHIDLQKRFMSGNQSVFSNAFSLASELKVLGVPNFWVAYNGEKDTDWLAPMSAPKLIKLVESRYKTNHIYQDEYDFDETDTVLPKITPGLFCELPGAETYAPLDPRHPHYHRMHYKPFGYLNTEKGKDTFIVTGVHASACVKETILGGLREARKNGKEIELIVPEGCTNYGAMTVESYVSKLCASIKDPEEREYAQNHVFPATRTAILDALTLAQAA